MKSDLFPMRLKELFAVSSLAVFFIGGESLGVVDNMLFQRGDLAILASDALMEDRNSFLFLICSSARADRSEIVLYPRSRVR